jgi:hypothetical protein
MMKASRSWPEILGSVLCVLALAMLVTARSLPARGDAGARQGKSDSAGGARLHLEVTGGDPATPVEAASVYVRYLVKHRMAKDETIEMNLKTGRDGTVLVPFVPRGEITVQIVAEHWKPFGQRYQITEDGQTLKIHLDKPPKWY